MLHDKVDENTNGKNTSETISHKPNGHPTKTNSSKSVSQNGEERHSRVAMEEGLLEGNPEESQHGMRIYRASEEEQDNTGEIPKTAPSTSSPSSHGVPKEKTEEEGDQQDGSRPPPAPLSFAVEDHLHAIPATAVVPPSAFPHEQRKTSLPRIPSCTVDEGSVRNGPSSAAACTSAGGAPPHPIAFSSSSFSPTPASPDGGNGGVEVALDATSAGRCSLSSSAASSASHHHLGSSMERSPSKECHGITDISPSPSHDGVRSAAPSTPPHPLTSFSTLSLEETLPLEHWMGGTVMPQERGEKGAALWPTWPVSFRVGEAVRSREDEESAATAKGEEERHERAPSAGRARPAALFHSGTPSKEEEEERKASPTQLREEYQSEEETESVGEGCTTPFQLHPPAWPLLDPSGGVEQRDGNHSRHVKPIARRAGKQGRSTPLCRPSASASPLPSVVSFVSPRFPPPASSSSSAALPSDGVGEVWSHSLEGEARAADQLNPLQRGGKGGPRTATDTMASPRRYRCGMPPLCSDAPTTSSQSSGSEKKREMKKNGGGVGEQRLVDEAPITIAGVNLEDARRKRLKKVSHYILGPLLGEGMYGVVRDAIDISATPQCVTSKKGASGGGGGAFSSGPSLSNAASSSKDALRPHGGSPRGSSVPPRTRQAEREAMRAATPDGGGRRRHASASPSSSSSSMPSAPGHQQFHRCAVKIMTVPPETGTKTHKSLMTGGKRRTAGHSNRAALLRAAYQKEVENLQRFHCPYIMRAMDLFSRYGKEYMVLPIAICSLQEFIVQRRQYAIAGQEWSALGEEEQRHMPRDQPDDALHSMPHTEKVDVGHTVTDVPSISSMPGPSSHHSPRRRRSKGGGPPAWDPIWHPPRKKKGTPHHPPFEAGSPWKDGPWTSHDEAKERHHDAQGVEIASERPKEDVVIGTVVTRRRKASSSSFSASSCSSEASASSSSVSSASCPSYTSTSYSYSSYASSRSASSHGSHRSYCMACADASSTSSHPSESTSMTDALTSPASLELLPVCTSSSSPSFSPRDFTQSGAGGVPTDSSTPRSRRVAEQSGAMRFPLPPPSGDVVSGSGSGGGSACQRRRVLLRGQHPSPPPDTTFLLGADAQGEQKTKDMREHSPVSHAALHSSPRYSSSRIPHGKEEDSPHGLSPSSPRNPSAVVASLPSSKRSRLPGGRASPHKRHASMSHPTTGTASARFGGSPRKPTRPALRSLFSATLIKAAFYQILSAVTYLHQQNLAHNDIKPSNILLFEDGTLRLTDLAGISAHYKDQGTPLFASPELARHYYGCGTEKDATTPTLPTPKKNDASAANVAATEAIPSPSSSSPSPVPFAPILVVPPPPAVPLHTSGTVPTEASSPEAATIACPLSLPQDGQEEVRPNVDAPTKETDEEEEVVVVDPKACDMWCCGLVLYTMVTGKPGPLPIQLAYDAFHHDTVMEGQHFPINRFQLYRFIADQQTPVNLEDIPHFRTASSAAKEKHEPKKSTTPTKIPTAATEGTGKEETMDEQHHVTGSLRDLLSGLLELDPGKRLTAEQALRHPWMELKFIRRGGGGKHTPAVPHGGAEGRGKAGRTSKPHHHGHHCHHPPFPRHGSLELGQAPHATNAPESRMHLTDDLKGKRKAKQKEEEKRRRDAAEEGSSHHFPPLTSLSADDIVVSSHDIIALSSMAAEYSMNYAIQRQVASRVLASHHFKAMIVKDKQRHLQFVADCCQTLGIPIPHEILLSSASFVNERIGGGSVTAATRDDPATIRGEREDLLTRVTTEGGGGGVDDGKSRKTTKGMDASIEKVDRTEMQTATDGPPQDGTNRHTHSTWETNPTKRTNNEEAVLPDNEERAMTVVEPAMGKVVRNGYCPAVMPPGCVHPHLFLPESEADYYERKNGMPEFDIRSLLDLDDVPLEVLCSAPFVPLRTGSYSHLAPRYSRTTPIKVQQMEEYLHNRVMVELGYRTKPDPFYVAERIGPLSFDAEEEEEEEEEEEGEDEGETMDASVSNRTKIERQDASKEAKKGTRTMPTIAAAPFSPPSKEDASRRDVAATTTVVGNHSVASSLISAEWSRSPTPAGEGMPKGDRTSTASTENSFSDAVSVRTQESAMGVDKVDKRKQEEIMPFKKEKISSEEKRMNKGLSALGSTLSHSSFASHRDPTAAAAEVAAKDVLSSPPCSSAMKKPVLPNSSFTRPHLTHAKGDLPVSTSAYSLSQKIVKGGEEKSNNTISHRNNNSGILNRQRTPTNNSFTSFQSGSSAMSSSVLPIQEGKESQSDDQQATSCDTPPRRVKDQSDRNGKRKKKGYSSGSSTKNSNNGMNSSQSVADARRIQESSRCFCGLV